MKTEEQETESPKTIKTDVLAKFSATEAAIGTLLESLQGVSVSDVEDREGLAKVHKGRMDLRGIRVAIEGTRKDLNADALLWTRTSNAEAKRLTALAKPREDELHAMEKAIEEQKEALRQKEREAKLELLRARMEQLQAVGSQWLPAEVESLDEIEFDELLTRETLAFEEKQAETRRLAEETAAREMREAERKRKEREQLEADQAKLEEEKAELEREKQALAEEKARLAPKPELAPEPEPAPATVGAYPGDEIMFKPVATEQAQKDAAELCRECGAVAPSRPAFADQEPCGACGGPSAYARGFKLGQEQARSKSYVRNAHDAWVRGYGEGFADGQQEGGR